MTKLFAFAANSDPSGVADIASSHVFNAYIARAGEEYKGLSATPTEYKAFLGEISKMWETQPKWTPSDLATIKVPTWIVDGDHDEAIKRENTEFMAANIPGAGLLIQPEASHFSFLQDPEQFSADILHFLERGGESPEQQRSEISRVGKAKACRRVYRNCGDMVGTALRAFAHPTRPVQSHYEPNWIHAVIAGASDEAINCCHGNILDCFATLAMTEFAGRGHAPLSCPGRAAACNAAALSRDPEGHTARCGDMGPALRARRRGGALRPGHETAV